VLSEHFVVASREEERETHETYETKRLSIRLSRLKTGNERFANSKVTTAAAPGVI
jgi:hypothetical protein